MWTLEQWMALGGVVAILLTAIAGITKAIADLILATRKKDPSPAPQLGIIPSSTSPSDDIDYRAYLDMKTRAETAERQRDDLLLFITNRNADHIDEDTRPIDHKESP